MRFEVGDRVRCVDNSGLENVLSTNRIYVVEKEELGNRLVSNIWLDIFSGLGFKSNRFELVTKSCKSEEKPDEIKIGDVWIYDSKEFTVTDLAIFNPVHKWDKARKGIEIDDAWIFPLEFVQKYFVLKHKPCPFCGGQPNTIRLYADIGVVDETVSCNNCGARISREKEKEAVDAWNKRTKEDSL